MMVGDMARAAGGLVMTSSDISMRSPSLLSEPARGSKSLFGRISMNGTEPFVSGAYDEDGEGWHFSRSMSVVLGIVGIKEPTRLGLP